LYFTGAVSDLIVKHGSWVVAGIVGLESMGLPLPGETTLILAAAYAGSTQHLDISHVIAAAAFGSIVGDNIGFLIGREFGYRLLLRYGHYVRLTGDQIKLGQYLFQRHGGKIVFFGRFLPALRMLAALLAGVNRMPWGPFLFFNAAGGILWATVYGLGSYYLGREASRLAGPLEIGLVVLVVIIAALGLMFLHRHQQSLMEEARRALPGPLPRPDRGDPARPA
jgi:membrane protein DedA with SNARE-associated domain